MSFSTYQDLRGNLPSEESPVVAFFHALSLVVNSVGFPLRFPAEFSASASTVGIIYF